MPCGEERRLGTGPSTTTRSTTTDTALRLLPVEGAADDEHQEPDDPHPQSAGGPVPGHRRKLGDRGP
ncbi:hypothetical protein [Streptomyces sp. NRRL B-3648]|uniref:hypothetical protein n=1 Tax=Streptomyces sp. NRRL B-3648 TaxID=1519493 RepID=UPI0007C64F0A